MTEIDYIKCHFVLPQLFAKLNQSLFLILDWAAVENDDSWLLTLVWSVFQAESCDFDAVNDV